MRDCKIDQVFRHRDGDETIPFMSWRHGMTGWLTRENAPRVLAYYVTGRGWYSETELEQADPRSGPRL